MFERPAKSGARVDCANNLGSEGRFGERTRRRGSVWRSTLRPKRPGTTPSKPPSGGCGCPNSPAAESQSSGCPGPYRSKLDIGRMMGHPINEQHAMHAIQTQASKRAQIRLPRTRRRQNYCPRCSMLPYSICPQWMRICNTNRHMHVSGTHHRRTNMCIASTHAGPGCPTPNPLCLPTEGNFLTPTTHEL